MRSVSLVPSATARQWMTLEGGVSWRGFGTGDKSKTKRPGGKMILRIVLGQTMWGAPIVLHSSTNICSDERYTTFLFVNQSGYAKYSLDLKFFYMCGNSMSCNIYITIHYIFKNIYIYTSNNQRLVNCVRFQHGLIVAKDIGSFLFMLTCGWHHVPIDCRTCNQGYLRHIASASIHQDGVQTLKSNGITSIHAGPPHKTHGTDFEKRHD